MTGTGLRIRAWLIIALAMLVGSYRSSCIAQAPAADLSDSIQVDFDFLPRYVFYGEQAWESVRSALRVKNNGNRSIPLYVSNPLSFVELGETTPSGEVLQGRCGVNIDPGPDVWPHYELRPGMSYAYRHAVEFYYYDGVPLREPGTYKVVAKLRFPRPLRPVAAEGTVTVVPFDERNVVWKKMEEIEVRREEGKWVSPGIWRITLMKYELPDGVWLFYAADCERKPRVMFRRLAPVEKEATVTFLVDPLGHEQRVICVTGTGAALRGTVRGSATHILVSAKEDQLWLYLMVGMTSGESTYERRYVAGRGKSRLERQPDGNVVLVEEK